MQTACKMFVDNFTFVNTTEPLKRAAKCGKRRCKGANQNGINAYGTIQCESIERKPRFNLKSHKNKNKDHKTNNRE